MHALRRGVDPDTLIHHHGYVFLVAQDGPDGLRNIRRRQHRKRHLVQQRLEQVVVAPVDQGHIDGQMRQSFRRVNPAKSAADNDDARPDAAACRGRDCAPAAMLAFSCVSSSVSDAGSRVVAGF